MSKILGYGISIPRFQIENSVLHPRKGKKGKRRIIFSDEDSITLAFDAACRCFESCTQGQNESHFTEEIDAVLFASTTPVFQNRYHASFLAEMLDLRKGILAMDLTASPRSGTDALLMAFQLMKTDNYKKILLLAADSFFPPIGDEFIPTYRNGHAGCALLIGSQDGIAEIRSARTFSSFIAEDFTYKGNPVQLDSRFSRSAGFASSVDQSLDNFLSSGTHKSSDYDKVILNSIHAKSAKRSFGKRGFDIDNQLVKDELEPETGSTGVCHAIILLIDCLEKISGNTLLIDYYNGTNIFHIEQADREHKKKGRIIQDQLKDGVNIKNYQDYLVLKNAAEAASNTQKREIFSSYMMLEREKENVLHLKGLACTQCGTVYFIKTQRCKKCKNETFRPKKLAKRGVIFTFTKEFYFPSSFPPVTMAVIDLEGGGRLTLQMTDEMYPEESDENLIGSEVRLVLRKMMETDTNPNYFWKCKRC